jgi:hypothetical protein
MQKQKKVSPFLILKDNLSIKKKHKSYVCEKEKMMKVQVAKGSNNYEIVGSGFPIFMLHSMGTDHRSMKPWIEPIFKTFPHFWQIFSLFRL